MKYISVILIACAAFLLSSCGDAEEKYRETGDCSVHFFIDTTASLGAEILMDYKNEKPISSHILIQEEIKRTMITYNFLKDSIIAQELVFFYKIPLAMRRDTSSDYFWKDFADSAIIIRYILNYDGSVIWKDDSLHEIDNWYLKIDSMLHLSKM